MRFIGIGAVSIHGWAVKGDHDDLAAIAIVAFFVLFASVTAKEAQVRSRSKHERGSSIGGLIQRSPLGYSASVMWHGDRR
jgi:hypothetical protein